MIIKDVTLDEFYSLSEWSSDSKTGKILYPNPEVGKIYVASDSFQHLREGTIKHAFEIIGIDRDKEDYLPFSGKWVIKMLHIQEVQIRIKLK